MCTDCVVESSEGSTAQVTFFHKHG